MSLWQEMMQSRDNDAIDAAAAGDGLLRLWSWLILLIGYIVGRLVPR